MLGFFFNSGKYLVCDTKEKQEPKSWLRTDFIEFNGAKRVFIYIGYTIGKCKSNSKYCKEQFKLYTAQTNKSASSPKPPNGFEEIALANPKNLKDGVPDEKDVIVLNATIKAKMGGFYLALLDQGVCLTLYSIKLVYYVCPERGKYLDLIKFPKTISPAEDIVGSQGQEVHGFCSDSNAKNTTELLGVCTTKGVWKVNSDVRCLCKPGYGYLPTPKAHCAEQTSKSASSPKPPNGFEVIAVANPKNLKDGVPDEKDVIVLNATIKAKMDGFYLALLDQGVCLTLYSIKVVYYVCPERGKYLDLIKFPKTISPAEDIVGSQSQEVHGSCSDPNAKNKTELLGVCTTKGVWKVNRDVRCLCKPGHEYLPTPRAHCAECGHGQYKNSLNNSKCKRCPNGSYSFGRNTMCVCHPGLFRMNKNKYDEPCYALPSGPKSINTTTWNRSSILVSWIPSRDKALAFTVECFMCKNDKDKKCVEPCNSKTIFHPGKSDLKRQVLVSGLKSGSRFKFLVFGVKRLNQKVQKSEWKYSVTFGNTKEG
ncbi:Ephrin type-A receptor 3 [Exaiptasia diaphana]|nr:Ephrin type-A receptor 3 [Exaiptasia diaphana]